MKSYKTGILTFWNVPNYGTFIQAYALQKAIEKIQNGGDVRQIAYLHKHHYDFYYSPIPMMSRKSLGFWKQLVKNLLNRSVGKKREKAFCADYETIPHTEAMDAGQLRNTPFDTVVLGSDIVWDYSIKVFGDDPFLFGVGLNSDNVVSYAASFGTVKPDQPMPDYVKQGLKQMKHISVRDENSADIVQGVCGVRPPVVLDPVWMWDFASDSNVQLPEFENYIVVYGQDFTQPFIENLIAFAKKEGKQLVCLDCNDDNYDWCDIVIKQQDLTPYKWLGILKSADYVATSTFHGLTFGLVFKKRIAFCKTDFIMAKVSAFLKKLGIYDVFLDQNAVEAMFRFDWDYTTIDSVINVEREKSMNFLREALGQ
ncbi:MAG: polysaccharide pyruvyl transferase family protein [Oscillospiraceae bacterium]|nr:polysaccharide pyruvyl transferase family protein [Oscillospiraceae bacterium]